MEVRVLLIDQDAVISQPKAQVPRVAEALETTLGFTSPPFGCVTV